MDFDSIISLLVFFYFVRGFFGKKKKKPSQTAQHKSFDLREFIDNTIKSLEPIEVVAPKVKPSVLENTTRIPAIIQPVIIEDKGSESAIIEQVPIVSEKPLRLINSITDLRKAVIWREILSEPVGMRG